MYLSFEHRTPGKLSLPTIAPQDKSKGKGTAPLVPSMTLAHHHYSAEQWFSTSGHDPFGVTVEEHSLRCTFFFYRLFSFREVKKKNPRK